MATWVPAVFGLLGVLIGGLINLMTNWLSERRKRTEQVLDRRWEACVDFLRATDIFVERARALSEALSDKLPENEVLTRKTKHDDAWFDVYTSGGPIRLTCSEEVSLACGRVKNAAADYSDNLDNWAKNGRRPPNIRFDSLAVELESARNSFGDIANKMFRDEEDLRSGSIRAQ